MPRECRVCKPGFYKELPAYEYSYEKCILCTLCFGFIVAQDCDPRHGRICGDTCIEDFYLKHVRCQKCCKCMEGDMKEDGCKNSTTRKFCGSDSNGECKEKVKSLPLRSTQPNSTTQQSSTATAQITERNSKTSSSTIRPVVTMNADSFHTANLKTREMSSQGTLSTSYSTIYSQGELRSTKATTHVATKMRTELVPRYTGPSIHTVVVKVSSRSLTTLSAILPYSTNLPQSSTPSPRISNRLSSTDIIWIVGGVVLVFAILLGIVVKAKESGVKCCIGGVNTGSRCKGGDGDGTNNTGGAEHTPFLQNQNQNQNHVSVSYNVKDESVSFIHSLPRGSIGSRTATEQPLLSKLKEDYNFVGHLESKLEGTSINNIKDLLHAFELPYADRCKILKCATQCLAFFENLSKNKPHLSLSNLKDTIENNSSNLKPNTEIFMKIERDIANGIVPFTLDTTLGELSNEPKNWLYILEEVACKLVPDDGTQLTRWENIASAYSYSSTEIASFQQNNNEETPTRKLLLLLCTKYPSLPVRLFVEKLRQIGREDVAIMVERWSEGTMDSEL